LETKIAGEALFNDGIALVLFVSILRAIHNPDEAVSMTEIMKVFFIEVLGAIVTGVVLGLIALRVLAKTPDPKIHVMFTLAMVTGGQLLATWLHISAPLMMVTAGIFLGNYGKKYAMHEDTVVYLDTFWEVIDEILNVILFALIGFQLLFIKNYNQYWKAGLLVIVVVLLARFISILVPSLIVRLKQKMPMRVILFLTWGGLRGGISIALALTLSYRMHKDLFVFITYCVVVFSVVIQGLTLERFFLRSKPGKTPVIEESNVGDEK
jgi:CPA1 family monovalent cation:H+ antiporter